MQDVAPTVHRHKYYGHVFGLRVYTGRQPKSRFSLSNVAHDVGIAISLVIHKIFYFLFCRKAKNARSKRVLEARQPKEIEDARTAVFLKGTHSGEVLNGVMKELVISPIIILSRLPTTQTQMSLKRPHAIAFNKKNDIHPFDNNSNSAASLEFWANKNDASLFVIGQTTKKRPHGLTFVRMYDGKVLDMLEVGVDSWVSMAELKVTFFCFICC